LRTPKGTLAVGEASSRTPDARLWQSVIIQAIRDLWIKKKVEFEDDLWIQANLDAEDWLFTDNPEFLMACHRAGWLPEWIRENVRKLQVVYPTKAPFLRVEVEISGPSLDVDEEEL